MFSAVVGILTNNTAQSYIKILISYICNKSPIINSFRIIQSSAILVIGRCSAIVLPDRIIMNIIFAVVGVLHQQPLVSG